MKVLLLTWEFPPFITGGLGMACYGLSKALLENGVSIDLFLPAKEDVYFPLQRAEDADDMPVHFFDKARKAIFTTKKYATLRERLQEIGISISPESYITPGFSFDRSMDWIWHLKTEEMAGTYDQLKVFLSGNDSLFKKVQEFTSRILKNAINLRFDVIHAHDWLTYPAAMLLKRITGKPLVAHIHATEFDRAGGPGDGRIHNIEYMGMSAADRVIAVSRYTSQMVIDRYLIDSRKVRIVHNAFSIDESGDHRRRKLFKEPTVLFLGRITLQKGPDYFVKVAEKVLAEYPNVRFIMAGTGDMFSRLVRTSASKRLKDRFLFAGFLNREQVEKILLSTDIFVMPSVSEPFGIVPLEAMAFGAVAIISKQSGVSEVVQSAYKIDFWDIDKTASVIVELLKDPEKRREIAERGKKEVLKIAWQEAAQATVNVYKELVCST